MNANANANANVGVVRMAHKYTYFNAYTTTLHSPSFNKTEYARCADYNNCCAKSLVVSFDFQIENVKCAVECLTLEMITARREMQTFRNYLSKTIPGLY